MNDFSVYILTALALVFVIEGLAYALFPEAIKNMMKFAQALPTEKLRLFGALSAGAGFFLVWILQTF